MMMSVHSLNDVCGNGYGEALLAQHDIDMERTHRSMFLMNLGAAPLMPWR